MGKRICFFTECYYIGGVDTFIIDLVNNWPSKEDHITLICNKSHNGIQHLGNEIKREKFSLMSHDMPVAPIYQEKIKNRIGNNILYKIISFFLVYSLMVYYILCSYRKCSLNKYDCLMVINGGYPAGYSCRGIAISYGLFSGKKSIQNFHNYAVPARKIQYIPEYIIDKLVSRYTKYFVSVSKSCINSLKNRDALASLDNIRYIYNGSSEKKFDIHLNIKKDLGIPLDSKICLMLATYEVRKGHDFIFKVFQKIVQRFSNAYLVCCGYGNSDDMERICSLVKLYSIENNTRILGYQENAMSYLMASDILLIASQEFESFGLTAIEAMKCHKPVVSTDTGGLKEVINNSEGGFLFDCKDVNGYTECLINMLENSDLIYSQGELGYKRYQRYFSIDKMTNAYQELIISL